MYLFPSICHLNQLSGIYLILILLFTLVSAISALFLLKQLIYPIFSYFFLVLATSFHALLRQHSLLNIPKLYTQLANSVRDMCLPSYDDSKSKVWNTTLTWVYTFPLHSFKKKFVLCVFSTTLRNRHPQIAGCDGTDVLVVQPGYQNFNNFDSRQVPIFFTY